MRYKDNGQHMFIFLNIDRCLRAKVQAPDSLSESQEIGGCKQRKYRQPRVRSFRSCGSLQAASRSHVDRRPGRNLAVVGGRAPIAHPWPYKLLTAWDFGFVHAGKPERSCVLAKGAMELL
jgi:hypothetical protein